MLLFLELIISIKADSSWFFIHIKVNLWSIRQAIGYIKHCSTWCWLCCNWFKRIVKLTLEIREVFLDIIVSLTAIMSKSLFAYFHKYTRSSKFLFTEHALIWRKESNFSFWRNNNDWIWSISKYLNANYNIFRINFLLWGIIITLIK